MGDPPFNSSSNRFEMSCFQSQGLEEQDEINLAFFNNIIRNNKNPGGYCIIDADRLKSELNLILDFNNVPQRHVDIISWPEAKSARQMIGLQMAKMIKDNEIVEFKPEIYLK